MMHNFVFLQFSGDLNFRCIFFFIILSCFLFVSDSTQFTAKKMGANLVKYSYYGENQYQSPIMELNIDGLKEIFGYLPLTDLLSFRRTCIRFKKAVDNYIKTCLPNDGSILLTDENIIKFLHIQPNNFFSLIKEIRFNIVRTIVTRGQMERIKGILSQVTTIKVDQLKFHGDFYGNFLKFCPNLKHLHIKYDRVLKMGTGNEWLLQRYPTIDDILFDDINYDGTKIVEMKTFFILNPQIKNFTTTMNFFLEHQDLFYDDNIHLKKLKLIISSEFDDKLLHFLELLSKYQENREQLNGNNTENEIKMIWKFPVINLDMDFLSKAIPTISDLKQFECFSGTQMSLCMNFTKKFVDNTYIVKTSFYNVLQLVRNLRKLRVIIIEDLEYGNVLDLVAINKERQLLNGACKTKLYVGHDIYFATKLAMKMTKFSLIELSLQK